MIFQTGIDTTTNLSFCRVKNDNLDESIKLNNHLELKLGFENNPLFLNTLLLYNNMTEESSVQIISLDSKVKSDTIKDYLISFLN